MERRNVNESGNSCLGGLVRNGEEHANYKILGAGIKATIRGPLLHSLQQAISLELRAQGF